MPAIKKKIHFQTNRKFWEKFKDILWRILFLKFFGFRKKKKKKTSEIRKKLFNFQHLTTIYSI